MPTKIAGQVDDAELRDALARYAIEEPDRTTQLAVYVVGRALEEAGLATDGREPLEYDLIIGTGHGSLTSEHQAVIAFVQQGFQRMRPTSVLRGMMNRPASVASIRYRITGASFMIAVACASGAVAVGEAFHRIRSGVSEGVIAACSDAALDAPTLGAWNRLGVMSRNPDPVTASRPFDRRRDGLVMGEGAAAFVLESLDAAERRGAPILAEVLGYGCTSDAHSLARPAATGQARAIRKALEVAAVEPRSIDYINAHGTATDIADVVEAESIRTVFGEDADRIPVSNTKAQLGHLMGATGGVEMVATMLALREGVLPPSRNLDEPDPRCPLHFVREHPQKASVRLALKNSFAFGGTNSAIVLGRG